MKGESEGSRPGRPTFETLEPRLLLSGVSAVPGMPDLLDAFDTGVSQSDDITRLDNSDPSQSLTFSVSGAAAPTRRPTRRRSQDDIFEDEFSALDVDPLMTVDV